MTQPASDRRKEYAGNDVTTVFDGPRAFSASHIAVYSVDDATGTATLTTAYTLTHTGGRRATTVTMDVAPATGTTLLILRTVPFTQETDITNQGAYLPEVVEQAMDSIAQQVQQLDDRDNRTIRLADTIVGVESAEVTSITPLGPVVVNAEGTGFEIGDTELTGDMLLRGALADDDGASLVAFLQSGDGAVASDVLAELRYFVRPEQFGAVGDGVTDDAAAFNAALAACAAAGGGQVLLSAKDYGIGDKIALPTGCGLVGTGCGQYPAAAFAASVNFTALPKTRIVALAAFPAATPMVECKPAVDPLYIHHGLVLSGLLIDCAAIAERGIDCVSVKNSQFRNLLVFRPTSIGILEDVLPVADASTEGNNATQFNRWEDVDVWCGNTGSAVGWRQTGTASHNVNQNSYDRCRVVHNDGVGIDMVNCDTNIWTHTVTYAFGAGYGCAFRGHETDAAQTARNVTMFGVQFAGPGAAQGGCIATNPGAPTNSILLNGYSTTNGAPLPVIENGARLRYTSDNTFVLSDPVLPTLGLHATRDWTTGGNSAVYQFTGRLTGASTDTDIGRMRWFQSGGAGTESTSLRLDTYQAGAQAERMFLGLGLVVGSGTDPGTGIVNAQNAYRVANTKVVGTRETGWLAMTGTANKATAYATGTITLIQLAERVKALQDALAAHGLTGT